MSLAGGRTHTLLRHACSGAYPLSQTWWKTVHLSALLHLRDTMGGRNRKRESVNVFMRNRNISVILVWNRKYWDMMDMCISACATIYVSVSVNNIPVSTYFEIEIIQRYNKTKTFVCFMETIGMYILTWTNNVYMLELQHYPETNRHQGRKIEHHSPSASAIYSIIGVTGEQEAKIENGKNAVVLVNNYKTCDTFSAHAIVKSVEIGNSNVRLFPPTRSATFNTAIQRLWNKRSLLVSYLTVSSTMFFIFKYSGCNL